ncbi:MAG: hypothetical protein OXB96_01875 [Candidatus Kaiserbacteria bacterium]|nr:hypothetical protein [Candidatus Kaiserbacteria bacterium]
MNFFTELKKNFRENPKSDTFFNNIFSFREFGNKTHGDMAEVLFDHYINKYLTKFNSTHIGKEKFRAKESEEDLEIQEKRSGKKFFLSLKNYGDNGPLQIRTDKENRLFNKLSKLSAEKKRVDKKSVLPILKELLAIHVLCFLYNQKENRFRVCVIDTDAALRKLSKIKKVNPNGRRKHPIYEFLDAKGNYIFEARYGGTTANALQRGIWTKTHKAKDILDVLFEGEYEVNQKFLLAIKELSLFGESELKRFLKRCGC